MGFNRLGGQNSDIAVDKQKSSRLGSSTGRAVQPLTISKRRFALKAVGEGAATVYGEGEPKEVRSPLKVLAGEFTYHRGMVKDLLADVGRSSKPIPTLPTPAPAP